MLEWGNYYFPNMGKRKFMFFYGNFGEINTLLKQLHGT